VSEQKKNAINRSTQTATRQAQALGGQDFVRGVIAELRRVTWPTQEEWISATVLTVALVVGIGLFTFGVDWLFTQLFQLIHPVA